MSIGPCAYNCIFETKYYLAHASNSSNIAVVAVALKIGVWSAWALCDHLRTWVTANTSINAMYWQAAEEAKLKEEVKRLKGELKRKDKELKGKEGKEADVNKSLQRNEGGVNQSLQVGTSWNTVASRSHYFVNVRARSFFKRMTGARASDGLSQSKWNTRRPFVDACTLHVLCMRNRKCVCV